MLRGLCSLFVVLIPFVSGCGSAETPDSNPPSASLPGEKVAIDGSKYLLDSEPKDVQNVIDLRKKARTGDAVVVAGQVGGSDRPFTEGRASFLMVDASFKPTAECDCPWDFCEYPKKDLANARVRVQFVDAEGRSLARSARDLFGIKELSSVVVQGTVRRDDAGNVTVVASRIFLRPSAK